MTLKPFEIFIDENALPPCMRTAAPVLIRHSIETAPLEWKVECGDREFYFESFREATSFCKGLGKAKNKNEN